jgi:protein O-mannosyl-transferase
MLFRDLIFVLTKAWGDKVEKSVIAEDGRYRGIIVSLLLAAIVLTVYQPIADFDFIALDDNLYVLENRHLQEGITVKSLIWAMKTFEATNWHPLTWLSLMADYELFGLKAGGYHMTSLLLHILNAVLLFLILSRMTGDVVKCAVVAMLFAVHPMNIESVVWIAERKNLLSAFFWFLTILAYIRYTERQGWRSYLYVLICFSLGLMTKPILVALPFVLLLLDYWPLQRFSLGRPVQGNVMLEFRSERRILIRLVKEKIPLFTLAALSALITYHAAQTGGAVKSVSAFPLAGRIANAFISYGTYLVKMAYPSNLAIFYPYPPSRSAWQVAAAVFFIVLASSIVYIKKVELRYIAVGWLWYLITLLPVIGFVQVGFQSMANRYAYLSLIGVFIIIAWGIPDLIKHKRSRRYLPVAAAVLIMAMAFCTRIQLPNWQNSESVFRRALRVTQSNHIAQMGMGNVWLARGDLQRARTSYEESLRIKPDYAEAHNNLALVLMRTGREDEAVIHYRQALKENPDFAEVHNNLGAVLAGQGKFQEAGISFRRAVELKPDYTDACSNLAMVFVQQGKIAEAIDQYRKVLAISSTDEKARKKLEILLKMIPLTQGDGSM